MSAAAWTAASTLVAQDTLSELRLGAGHAENDFPARVQEFVRSGYPIMNLHVHLKGGLTIEEAVAESRRTGVRYGVAINVGLGFPTTNDHAVLEWLNLVRPHPVYCAIQAEGREWVHLIRPETVAKFDYIFTDAMTWTDRRGRRIRLWIPAEVHVEDPEEFMDTLVERTVEIIEKEPIDILANPSYLPAALMDRYDELWTPSRIQPVVEAMARHGVAMEINARTRLPRWPMLRAAKAAGLKFSFGTNNAGADIGDLNYALEAIRELGLRPEDLFTPRPWGQRACDRKPWPTQAFPSGEGNAKFSPAPRL